jgi:ureidoglycolate lyase
MVALGERPIEFVVVQYANGVAEEDCQEHEIEAREAMAVDLGRGVQGDETLKAKL